MSNQALQNDSTALNLLADVGKRMVQGSVAQFRNVLLAPLLANTEAGQTMVDGLSLFHANHGNLAGAAAAMTVSSLGLARTAMRRQKDSMGTVLALEPKALLVPPELETLAQQLVAALSVTKSADVNPFAGGLDIIVEPGQNSTIAWYLLAEPAMANGLTYAYLFFHDWDTNTDTFSCAAFDLLLPSNTDPDPKILIRFVPLWNLLSNVADAEGRASIRYSELITNPAAVLSELTKHGFYISPKTTEQHVVGAIRQAMEFTLFAIRSAVNPPCQQE